MLALSVVNATPARRLAILPTIVEGQSGKSEASRVFDELAHAAELRVGIELVSYNELFVDGAETIASTVLACGSDMGCISRALRNARIELCLRAIVNFAVSPPLVSLSLIEGPGARILAESVVETDDTAPLESRLRFADGAAAMLDGAGFPRGGRIAVAVEPGDAKLVVRDCTTGQVFAAETKNAAFFVLPAGCYEMEATRDTYEPSKARVDVVAGEVSKAHLSLRPVAVAEDSGGVLSSPWFWAIAGGVAIAGGAAVLLATDPFGKSDTAPPCFCVVTANTVCPPCP